jgi:D-alanyl-D-alanine carboxypeptidase
MGLPKRRLPARLKVLAALLAGLAMLALANPGAEAAIRRHKPAVTPMPAGATDPDKDAALIIDGATGKVLYARNELLERHPASLTKMMTLYLLFEALKAGKITMQTQMPVSLHAQVQLPTKLSLRHGQTIDVDTAIRAIVIRSANDVAVVIAEALGGTESHFAEMMTAKARELGMKETNYHNASGLPDPLQITTASDLAVLARHLAYDFPQYFPYFGTEGFTYKGTYYPTHDNLVGRYPGADGIKTGYVGASGFNLASSVVRDDVHLIGIVMGGRTAVRRDLEMMHLMDTEFAQIETTPALVAHADVPWQAVASAAPPAPATGFTLAPATGNTSTQFAALSAVPPPLPAGTDEDAAESHRAPDENFATLQAQAPQLASAATPPQPVPAAMAPAMANIPIPAIRPKPRPATPDLVAAAPAPKPQQVAMATPAVPLLKPRAQQVAAAAPAAPKPQQLAMAAPAPPKPPPAVAPKAKPQQLAMAAPPPALRPNVGEAAPDQAATPGRNWTIQIGAFGDRALAEAQLNSYAAKAKDIIGEAAHIVTPGQSSGGHTLYRARFGPYVEREARDVCGQLTQRIGPQSCFPVVTR